ncbi:MAG: NADH-quinone oxidoreductase subunit K [Phycisphaerales bacterium]|jgi:multicomponent Na+:H+ antiporter subunit C|nr:NADH-quinone oxidoreductase subunit K [Planctomycetota bacterium]
MNALFAIVAGVLFACGTYLLMRRSIMRLVMGLVLIGHSANIAIFTATGLKRTGPAIVPIGEETLPATAADPLPQALVLTAIVISFGVIAFAVVLVSRVWATAGTDDSNRFREDDDMEAVS